MKIPEDGCLLRIFIGEADRWHGKPAHEAIVLKAKETGLAGATVLRGVIGFGAHSRLHTYKILRLSEDLPIVIEIIDAQEKIDAFLPQIDDIVQEGLITMESVRVIKYRAGNPPSAPPPTDPDAGQAVS
jgi:PII-like signaling protein